jgi:hypothetical protein
MAPGRQSGSRCPSVRSTTAYPESPPTKGIGISLYLESADPVTGYSLKFTTYRGVDHSTGGAGELVRLVPELDSIQDLKELRSIQQFKNVVYVYYKGLVTKHLLDPTAPEPEGFDRRVLVTDAAGEPVGHKITQDPTDPSAIRTPRPSWMRTTSPPSGRRTPRMLLANHNYIRAIDGQSSPSQRLQVRGALRPRRRHRAGRPHGAHFQGSSDRVHPFPRQTGEKEYPTISVIS